MIGRETRLEAALTAEAELISDLVVIGGGAAGMTAGRKLRGSGVPERTVPCSGS